MGTRVQYGPPSVDKALGALPVVAALCRHLDIAGYIDQACPVRDVAIVIHGQVIEALVANRLTSPTPLVHLEDWARAWAVPEVFGVDAEALNDDRIGRGLDAVAPELADIVGSIRAMVVCLLTNLDAAEADAEVLRRYKGQESSSAATATADPVGLLLAGDLSQDLSPRVTVRCRNRCGRSCNRRTVDLRRPGQGVPSSLACCEAGH